VAMTRAKDQLHLMVPQRFCTHGERGDRHVYAQRTRFIPDALLVHFDHSSWPAPRAASVRAAAGSAAPVDLQAKLRRMWD
ncbi:MAG: ATP-dependent helicase, partial [Pseudolabrys sp.]